MHWRIFVLFTIQRAISACYCCFSLCRIPGCIIDPVPGSTEDPFLPFTPDDDAEEFLPYTGAESVGLLGAAALAAASGAALKFRRRKDAEGTEE